MSKKEKLIERFKSIPADFTWSETVRLVGYFGFNSKEGDGSRVKFYDKPHPA